MEYPDGTVFHGSIDAPRWWVLHWVAALHGEKRDLRLREEALWVFDVVIGVARRQPRRSGVKIDHFKSCANVLPHSGLS